MIHSRHAFATFAVLASSLACSGQSPSVANSGGALSFGGSSVSTTGANNLGGASNVGGGLQFGGTSGVVTTPNAQGGAFAVGGGFATGSTANRGGASTGMGGTSVIAVGGRASGGVLSTAGGRPTNGGAANVGGIVLSMGGTPPVGGAVSGGSIGANAGGGGKAAIGGAHTGGISVGGGTVSKGGGASTLPSFIIGADISSVDEALDRGSRYADTDGTTKSIFDILKNHGFNFIRLRAFVDPSAQYGYAYGTGGSCIKSEPYCDTAHTVEFARQVKAAGMGLLLDLHYSDNWTDPGNQIIPAAWRNSTSITQLASYVRNYTEDIVSKLTNAGARPEIVQVGNETTPGMLMHVPNSSTDCWGNNVSAASIGGSASNWSNLGTLLKAGIEGVRAVDSSIQIMVHIENTRNASAVVSWVRNARNQGVQMDIVGLSCYVAFQGEPSVWQNTFSTLASTFTDLSFVIAEYNPQRTQANQIMRDLPGGRGLGTFFWEPTQSGEWGNSMFTWSGNTARANTADFQEFDAIAASVGLR